MKEAMHHVAAVTVIRDFGAGDLECGVAQHAEVCDPRVWFSAWRGRQRGIGGAVLESGSAGGEKENVVNIEHRGDGAQHCVRKRRGVKGCDAADGIFLKL